MPDPAPEPQDDPKPDDQPDPKPEKKPWGSDEDFSPEKAWELIQNLRGDKKSLQEERDAARSTIQEHEQSQLSEQEKLGKRVEEAEGNAKSSGAEAARLRVALRKGLTEVQAKRLVGESEEDLEADADELLESFKPADDEQGQEPSRRPRERLRPGAAPASEPEEMDPAKLAEQVGHGY